VLLASSQQYSDGEFHPTLDPNGLLFLELYSSGADLSLHNFSLLLHIYLSLSFQKICCSLTEMDFSLQNIGLLKCLRTYLCTCIQGCDVMMISMKFMSSRSFLLEAEKRELFLQDISLVLSPSTWSVMEWVEVEGVIQ